jgi:hypothetical protein
MLSFVPVRVGFLLIGVALLQGCSGETSSIPKTVEVSGLVTLNGTPLTEGSINFSSGTTGDSAIASINQDGRFLFGNGVLPGTYRVTITPSNSKVPPAPGVAPPKLNLSIPAKYGDPASTDLKAEVSSQSTDFTFDLK